MQMIEINCFCYKKEIKRETKQNVLNSFITSSIKGNLLTVWIMFVWLHIFINNADIYFSIIDSRYHCIEDRTKAFENN